MTNLSQSFNKLLEQYVFTTANQVIDLATPEQQAILIKLIIDIPIDSASANAQPSPVARLRDDVSQPFSAQSSTSRLVHNLWLTKLFERQIERNEASIAQVELAIESTQQGYQSRTNGVRSETDQATLETWHSHILEQYQKYLVTLQTIQRINRDRLSRLINN